MYMHVPVYIMVQPTFTCLWHSLATMSLCDVAAFFTSELEDNPNGPMC